THARTATAAAPRPARYAPEPPRQPRPRPPRYAPEPPRQPRSPREPPAPPALAARTARRLHRPAPCPPAARDEPARTPARTARASATKEGRSAIAPLGRERARPSDRRVFYPLRMCVGGLHVILRASRRAGVHTQNRGRSLDSNCRRQSHPGCRIEPPVLDLDT